MDSKELTLIQAGQSGDQEAFGQLYDQYFKKIYSFVYYKVSHKQSAEDLVADTFYKALANFKKFDANRGNFSSWLYKIARNSVIDHYRTTKETQDLENIPDFPEIDNNLDKKLSLDEVREKLYKLNEIQREIIILRVWHDLSYKEIAEIVGKSEDNCKMIFSRGIKELRLSLVSLAVLFALFIN